MRIGIDIRSLQNHSRNRGIGTYSRCLIKNLLSIDKENEYVFFVFHNSQPPDFLNNPEFSNVKIARVPATKIRLAWVSAQAAFPYFTAREKLDIFHAIECIVAAFFPRKEIITVFDFINSDYDLYRERSDFRRKIYFYFRDQTLKRANKLIAISEYTKQKIIELVGIKEDKIKLIYPAVDEVFRPLKDKGLFSCLRKKYKIERDFLLFVGAFWQHKNIHGLIKAFNQIKFKELGLVLVNVTNDMEYFCYIKRLIAGLKLNDKIYILGCIPQEDLAAIYNMAELVISVSFYEGFGLPILEAMSCAKPVIAASNTSMKEMVDSCGILVNPYNIDEITSAMDNLLRDSVLKNILSMKGLRRSQEFSWRRSAQEVLSAYQELFR